MELGVIQAANLLPRMLLLLKLFWNSLEIAPSVSLFLSLVSIQSCRTAFGIQGYIIWVNHLVYSLVLVTV